MKNGIFSFIKVLNKTDKYLNLVLKDDLNNLIMFLIKKRIIYCLRSSTVF